MAGSLAALGVIALPGACHKSAPNAAQITPSSASLKQSYDALAARLDALDTTFAALHARLAALPEGVAGLAEIRAKLLAAEEVLGVTGGKITWLSSELASALRANKREQLRTVSAEIAQTSDEMRELEHVGLELTHQLLPLERTAALQSSAPAALLQAPAQPSR